VNRRALALLLMTAFALAGCSNSQEVYVKCWRLQVANGAPQAVTLPVHLDLPQRDLTYRLRAKVELPGRDRGHDLVLAIPYLPARVTAYSGARTLVALSGDVGHGYRNSANQSWAVPAALTTAPELEIELVIEHRWSGSAWLDTVPRLRLAGANDPASQLIHAVNCIGAACGAVAMFQIGITYLVVFLVDRRRKAYFWFAVQGITAAYYPFFVLGYSQRLCGPFDLVLLSFLLSAAPIASVYFTHAHFGLGKPSRAWPAAMALATATLVIFHGPFSLTPMRMTSAIVFATLVYQLVAAGRLVLRRDRPAGGWSLLACWAVLGATAWTDVAYWGHIADVSGGARWACVGLTIFALLQSLMLSGDHSRSLLHADELNAALADRVGQLEQRQREIHQLNIELRRQIADRSRQLSEAIARIESRRKAAPEFVPGDIVEDRYRIVRVVGSGGMGTVYEVERSSDARRLALKVTASTDDLVVARLAREAQIAAAVVHPNVVGIVDVDVATSGVLFVVMEYVAGSNLHEQRRRFGDVPWVLAILRQVALGLAALHDNSIVHRDLKPANILLAQAEESVPVVKITDFGASRLGIEPGTPRAEVTPTASADDSTAILATKRPRERGDASPSVSPLTEVGAVVGTPRYMAPEVVAGHAAGPEADVFALGIIAFEALTRRYPFAESPLKSFLGGRSFKTVGSLVKLCPTLSPTLTDMVHAALNAQPSQRPSASALAQALEGARAALVTESVGA
jgi:Protein kinase domain